MKSLPSHIVIGLWNACKKQRDFEAKETNKIVSGSAKNPGISLPGMFP